MSLALLAVLLVAQLAALQHQLWHASGIALQGQHSGVPRADMPAQGSGNALCALHDALASVTAALGSTAPALVLPEVVACRHALVPLPAVEFPAPRPAARGPPLLS